MADLLPECPQFLAPAFVGGVPRSPHWPAVRAQWLREHGVCERCGVVGGLEVHHVLPYHLYPELELEPTNFMTLCELPGHDCHYQIHLLSWSAYDPDARREAKRYRKRVENRLTTREDQS